VEITYLCAYTCCVRLGHLSARKSSSTAAPATIAHIGTHQPWMHITLGRCEHRISARQDALRSSRHSPHLDMDEANGCFPPSRESPCPGKGRRDQIAAQVQEKHLFSEGADPGIDGVGFPSASDLSDGQPSEYRKPLPLPSPPPSMRYCTRLAYLGTGEERRLGGCEVKFSYDRSSLAPILEKTDAGFQL
jgi:hypothetical protein